MLKKVLFFLLSALLITSPVTALAVTYEFGTVRLSRPGRTLVALVEVADTFRERIFGLMHRDYLPEGRGMLFTGQRISAMWMKDTPLPLDILFINQDRRITRIVENAEPCFKETCPVYWAPRNTQHALEFAAGWVSQHQVAIGDRIDF